MNIADIIVLSLLGLAVFFAMRYMIKRKKKGIPILSCSGDCANCKGCKNK